MILSSIFTSIFRSQNPKSLSCCYHTFRISLLEDSIHENHFNQILSHAIAIGRFNDPFIASKLLYASRLLVNDFIFSRTLFFQIPNPNIFAWNFILKAYSFSPFPDQTLHLYNQLRRDAIIPPDNYTFPLILKACSRLSLFEKGQEIHSSCFKFGLVFDTCVQNSLITMYTFCDSSILARKVFDIMPSSIRDLVTWNAMIFGYLQGNQSENALKLLLDFLPYWASSPDNHSMVSAFTVCARVGFIELGKKLHGLLILSGYILDAFVGSSLINMYAKCKQIENARKVFDGLPVRNIVCWTSIICGYAQSDFDREAINLFMEMHASRIISVPETVACVVSACAHLGAIYQGRSLHCYCLRNCIDLNLAAKSAFIDMYSKCGQIRKAALIFDSLAFKDETAWSAMISGFAMNGDSDEALRLFSLMEASSGPAKPNEIIFLGVLSACSHAGYVEKGLKYFKSMAQSYNLTPRVEHYSCVVDLLGRANHLEEAKRFVSEMPISPDMVTWRSLLSAGRNHGDIELVEFAANRIEELDPSCRCRSHDLVSNAYASASLWRDVKRVRDEMVVKNARKRPGYTFVEVNGIVREFYAGD